MRRDAEYPAKGQPPLEKLLLPVLDRDRNATERMFGRPEDFCGLATRYDRLARNFLSAVCLDATATY